MFESYRRVLSLPGAAAFSATGFLSRLPLSMTGLGLVLIVSARTGSYGLAGTVSGAYILGAAAGAPFQGRLIDSLGQRRILQVLGTVYALGIALSLVVIESDLRTPWPHLCVAVAGLASPQTGSMVRARWSHVISDRSQLNTAFSLEAVIDEMVFASGPVLVTFLTVEVAQYAGVGAAAMTAFIGCWLLASQTATEPQRAIRDGGPRPPLGWGLLGPVLFAATGLGVLFGATDVIVVAFSTELGHRSAAGPILAVLAAGSLLSGLLIGSMRLPIAPLRQLRFSMLLLSVLFLPLFFLHSIALLAVGMFAAGMMISPTLIAAMNLIELHVPPSRLTEGIAWTTTGMGIGVAPGAALAGWVIDHHDASAGFVVPLIAGLAAAVVAWSFRPPELSTVR